MKFSILNGQLLIVVTPPNGGIPKRAFLRLHPIRMTADDKTRVEATPELMTRSMRREVGQFDPPTSPASPPAPRFIDDQGNPIAVPPPGEGPTVGQQWAEEHERIFGGDPLPEKVDEDATFTTLVLDPDHG